MLRPLLIPFVAVLCAAQTPQISPNALKADVSFLASDALEGRGTPSRGLDIAAEYIAAQFRRAGLEPAGDDGYFQTAAFASVKPKTDGLALTLEAGGQTFKADPASIGLQEAAAADLQQKPVVTATMKSAAVLDALTPEQVRGNVLLLVIPPGTSLTRGIPAAIDRLGPAAVLSVRANGLGLNLNARLRDTASTAFRVPILAAWDPAIQKAAEAGGAMTATLHIPAPEVTPVKVRNVAGLVRGSDPVLKDTYVIVSAHYDHLGVRGTGDGDHIYNGADDDASGTASVIEIAAALAALPQHPRRSILFLTFFGEELGELGSQYYVQHPIFPLAKTVADINLEQLGRTDDTQGPHVGMYNFTGFDFTDIPSTFRKAAEGTGIRVVKDEKNSDNYFGSSDNFAFANAGVPSTTASVAYAFPDYHQPGDEWQKLDYENMAKVDRALALGIAAIADSTDPPRWNEGNAKTQQFRKALSSKP